MNTNESSWKPSDGQLECLEYAINNAEKDYSPLAGNRIYLTLKALKKQLEKIKNENIVMEDYKEKYNKLVEAIKALQEANPSNKGIQNWINTKVPELAESEDEKIRKDIRQCIKLCSFVPSNGTTKDEMFAWLEKQVSPDMVADAYLRGCNDTEKKWLESKRYTKMDVDNAYLEGIANAKRELEKQGEMDIEMDIEKPITIGKRRAVSGKLKELIDNKDHKSIEETKKKMLAETSKWTEEDEEMLDLIEGISCHNDDVDCGTHKRLMDWLLVLKQRIS